MKTVTRITILLSVFAALPLFLQGISAAAAPDVPAYIAEAPGLKEYPHEDGLILKQEVTITLLEDGRVKRHMLLAQKVLGEYMMRARQCDPAITFNRKTQELKILQARTYMADGTAADTRQNGFNEITPFALDRSPEYTDLRQMVVTFVGTEHFATNVLEYEITDRVPVPFPFTGEVELQADKPVLDQTVTLRVPGDRALSYALLGCDLQPAIEKDETTVTYTFRRTNVPGVNLAEQPARREYIETLLFTTCKNWKEVGQSIAVAQALDRSDAMAAKVDALIRGKSTPEEKIAAIHKFVVEGIRAVDWPVTDFDFRPRKASRVYQTGYGHVLDKAVLLAAMLRDADLNPSILLASPSYRFREETPAPTQLTDAWVSADVDGEEIFLHPNALPNVRGRLDLAGHDALYLFPPRGEALAQLAPRPADVGRSYVSGDLRLKTEKEAWTVSGSLRVTLTGRYTPLGEPAATGDVLQELANRIAASFWGAKAARYAVAEKSRDRLALEIDIDGGSLPSPDGVPLSMTTPLPEGSIAAEKGLQIYRATRHTPLLVRAPAEEKLALRIELPLEFKPAALPAPVLINNACGSVSIQAAMKEGEVTVERSLSVPHPVMQARDYPLFRKLILTLLQEKNRTILFEDSNP
jgi:hypothetical protein